MREYGCVMGEEGGYSVCLCSHRHRRQYSKSQYHLEREFCVKIASVLRLYRSRQAWCGQTASDKLDSIEDARHSRCRGSVSPIQCIQGGGFRLVATKILLVLSLLLWLLRAKQTKVMQNRSLLLP